MADRKSPTCTRRTQPKKDRYLWICAPLQVAAANEQVDAIKVFARKTVQSEVLKLEVGMRYGTHSQNNAGVSNDKVLLAHMTRGHKLCRRA